MMKTFLSNFLGFAVALVSLRLPVLNSSSFFRNKDLSELLFSIPTFELIFFGMWFPYFLGVSFLFLVDRFVSVTDLI